MTSARNPEVVAAGQVFDARDLIGSLDPELSFKTQTTL